jgi:hypothetical protein
LQLLVEGQAVRTPVRGATNQNADAYERIVRDQVIPGTEARRIPGFRSIDPVRREARAVLADSGKRSPHYQGLDRRDQPGDQRRHPTPAGHPPAAAPLPQAQAIGVAEHPARRDRAEE